MDASGGGLPTPIEPCIAPVMALAVSLSLLGCTAVGPAESPAARTTSAATSPAASPAPSPKTSTATSTQTTVPTSEAGDTMSKTAIRLTFGDRTLDATLSDNPAARSLISQLPLTLAFSDYGGQEVTAKPPQPLTMTGMPSAESAPVGTIGYYAPDQVIVLYYTDVGRFNGIVRLGQMNGDVSILEGWTTPRSVTIELA